MTEWVPGAMCWIGEAEHRPGALSDCTRWKPGIVVEDYRGGHSLKVRLWESLEAMNDGKHKGRKRRVYLWDCFPDPFEAAA